MVWSSFDKVRDQAKREAGTGSRDQSRPLRNLDAKQRKALTLFERSRELSAKDIAELFHFQPRTATALCQRWVAEGFFVVANSSRKERRYRVADQYERMFLCR